ncbi:MAG: energy-coupling factor ABC transporter permease [Rhodoferax sp.]
MHIEPGLVDGTKIFLSYATAATAVSYAGKLAFDTIKKEGALALLLRAILCTALVFTFFELMPHHPVGVSEVHLILGTTLMLIFGVAPASIGLVCGLLIQSVFFAQQDLPQYGINVTTLLVPLFATSALARRIIPENLAYVDISYQQAFKLSVAFQGGIVVWVCFWAIYGQGFGAENVLNIASFGAAYMTVVLVEPLIDLGLLAAAKFLHHFKGSLVVDKRLYSAA